MSTRNLASRRASNSGILPISGFRDPLSLPGLVNWLDFSDSQYLATATNGTGSVSNGSAIAYCADRSGSGYHATQSTANNRPTWSSTGLNSLGAGSFDGTNDTLVTPSIVPLVGDFIFTAFCVSTRASTSTGSQFCIGSSGAGFGIGDGFSGASRVYSTDNGSNFRMTYSATTTGQVHSAVKYAAISNSFVVRRNGVPLVGIDAQNRPVMATPTYTTAPVTLGNGILNVTNFHSGLIAEMIVYSRALTVAEILTVERYLGAKWGITVA
jgi:hypothetical protein